MPHDYDDLDDDSGDLRDFLTRMARRADQPGGAHDPESHWPPGGPYPERSRWRRQLLLFLGAATLVLLGALGVKLGLDNDGAGRADPSVAGQTMYAQREIPVHAAPSGDSAVVRRLTRGERVLVEERAVRGWVRVIEADGHVVGYAYEADGNLGRRPPVDTRRAPGSSQQGVLSGSGPENRRDTTAICRDGTPSFSREASGTCAGHGGVRRWINHP